LGDRRIVATLLFLTVWGVAVFLPLLTFWLWFHPYYENLKRAFQTLP